MSARLGLSKGASVILDAVQDFRWVHLDDLAFKRDAGEVRRAVAELVQAGLVVVRRGPRGKRIVELTEAGER